jgi:hypothetical protein
MPETIPDYIQRKMAEVQDLIQEATMAQALASPIITDSFDNSMQTSLITIKIIINEAKLNEYRENLQKK